VSKEKNCAERIEEAWQDTKETIRAFLEEGKREYKSINDLALCWDEDFHKGFNDLEPCDCLCFSYGGPADYLRFYHDGRITYVFQDWGDGAEKDLDGDDYFLCKELYDMYLFPM